MLFFPIFCIICWFTPTFSIEPKNEGGAGNFAGIGIGLGMMAGVGSTVGCAFAGMNVEPQGQAAKYCHQCGAELTPGASFCDNCGAKQEIADVCSKCGFKFIKPGKFCHKCGTKRGE